MKKLPSVFSYGLDRLKFSLNFILAIHESDSSVIFLESCLAAIIKTHRLWDHGMQMAEGYGNWSKMVLQYSCNISVFLMTLAPRNK